MPPLLSLQASGFFWGPPPPILQNKGKLEMTNRPFYPHRHRRGCLNRASHFFPGKVLIASLMLYVLCLGREVQRGKKRNQAKPRRKLKTHTNRTKEDNLVWTSPNEAAPLKPPVYRPLILLVSILLQSSRGGGRKDHLPHPFPHCLLSSFQKTREGCGCSWISPGVPEENSRI